MSDEIQLSDGALNLLRSRCSGQHSGEVDVELVFNSSVVRPNIPRS